MNTTTADSALVDQVDKRQWLKRAGIFGFWFFFVKGLLWLAAPLVFYFAM